MNQRRPFDLAESTETMLGTFTESAIDMATFGIISPDIIPEEREREHPYAAIIGNIAGSVAGMVPSFGVSSVAARGAGIGAKTVFNSFRFGGNIMKAAEAATKGAALTRRAFSMPGTGAVTFAIHDAAREYVRQVKEQDPSTYDLGQKALGGFITGGAMGITGSLTHLSNPVLQASAMGTTMTLAEAINDAAEGEDVMSAEWVATRGLPSFFMGTAIGAFNSLGYKERQKAENVRRLEGFMTYMRGEQIGVDPQSGKPVYKTVEDKLREINPKLMQKGQVPPELKDAFDRFKTLSERGYGLGKTVNQRKGNLHQIVRDKLGMEEDAYRAFLERATGKTSSVDFTENDWTAVTSYIDDYLTGSVAASASGGNPRNIRPVGFVERLFSPTDRVLMVSGANDLTSIKKASSAKAMQELELSAARETTFTMRKMWTGLYDDAAKMGLFPKRTAKGTAAKVFGGRADDAEETLMRALTKTTGPKETPLSDGEYDALMKSLTPEMKKFVGDYQRIQDFYHGRLNEVERLMGKELTSKRDYYARSLVDRAAMKRAGRGGELKRLSFDPAGESLPVSTNPRVSTQMQRQETDMLKVRDPFAALSNMIYLDTKAIYLHHPQVLVENEMKALRKGGFIDQRAADDVEWWMKHILLGRPTRGKTDVNETINRFLEQNKVGKAFDTVLAQMGKDLGGKPLDALSGLWGSAVSYGYIGGRARLALRNLMQFTLLHGFNDTPSIARGTAESAAKYDNPVVKEFKEKNLFWRMTTERAEESIATGGLADKAGMSMFQRGHVVGNDIGIKSTFHQVVSYMNAKGNKYGWATEEGIKLRQQAKAAGDKNWRYVLDTVEKERAFNEMEHVISSTFFLYNTLGMPGVYRTAAGPLFKLTSFPMNYGYKYIGELMGRLRTGKPTWAIHEGLNVRLPLNARAGVFRHVLFASALAAAGEAAGFDYSDLMGIGYTKKKGFVYPFSGDGILTMRPSPAMSAWLGVKNLLSSDERTRKRGVNELKNMAMFPPLAAKDIWKAASTGDRTGYFLYRNREEPTTATIDFTPKRRRSSVRPFSTPIRPFGR